MIKITDKNFSFTENVSRFKNKNSFLCRIISLYNAYGENLPFTDFWIETDESEKPVSAISRNVSQFTLYLTDESKLDDISYFLKLSGADTVLFDSEYKLNFEGFTVCESGIIMSISNKDMRYVNGLKVEVPNIKDVHNLLFRAEDEKNPSLPDFESFYLDVSHKLRHKITRLYGIYTGKELSCCAMTVAESDNSAIIGGVATDENYRRKGFGTLIVRCLCDQLINEKKTVYIYRINERNVDFYTRLGFEICGGWTEYRHG